MKDRFVSTQADGKTDMNTKNSTATYSAGDQPKAGDVGNDAKNPYGPGAADGKK